MSDVSSINAQLLYMDEDGQQCSNNPSLIEIIGVLMAMDGCKRDSLSVTLRGGGCMMAIGGGANGQFKCDVDCRAARGENKSYDLINPNVEKDMNDTVDIQMEREIATFPRCVLVTRDDVRRALECFCLDGVLCDELVWDNTLKYDAYS